jgi:putative hydrolase
VGDDLGARERARPRHLREAEVVADLDPDPPDRRLESLERLVTGRDEGRQRIYSLNGHRLTPTHDWVQSYFRSQLETLINSLDFDPQRMQSMFEGLEMLDPERLAANLADPDQIIRAGFTSGSQEAMQKLQAFMTLAEGYATFVMDAVGAKLLSDHARLKEVMERRKRSQSAGEVLFERLLGVELKRQQYEQGVKFCRYVAGMRDVESLNRAWSNPESLPTLEEIDDPDAWIKRVLD